jgi:hypothetical protein
MANLKNITELPVAESADGLNLIVNDNGAAKQLPANKIAQAVGDGITTVNFVDHYDEEADESHFVCPLAFAEVYALTTGNISKPVFFVVADSESSDWGYATMSADTLRYSEEDYILLTISKYDDRQIFAFGEFGEVLSMSFPYNVQFNFSDCERWGTISWGVAE